MLPRGTVPVARRNAMRIILGTLLIGRSGGCAAILLRYWRTESLLHLASLLRTFQKR